MSYQVKQGNIFGRIGTGIGKGFAEAAPKEIERGRLAQGLNEFEQQSSTMTPLQQLARLSSIPGITPQMIASFGDLAKQQAKANAFNQPKEPAPSPFSPKQSASATPGSDIPSIPKAQHLEEIQEGYIPPTQEEIMAEAKRLYDEKPAYYQQDPERAIKDAESAAARREAINTAHETQHTRLNKIQDNVVTRLKDHAKRLNVKIPANLYSKIEDRAIQATKPKKDGGGGLTEQQAMKQFGKEMDEVSRDYEKINTIGNWGITGRKSDETLRTLKGLQSKFEKNDDTENFADTLISENKLSPMVAYSIAEPVSRVPEAAKVLRSLPKLEPVETAFESKVPPKLAISETLKAIPKLVSILKDNEKLSPLAVAYELEKKGYDPQTWLDYITEHSRELNLKSNQMRQVDTPNNLIGTWNDWWLSSWSGL